ncbi:anaerobic ribonucleoside-triphosphate reductase activating protein [Methanomicrobium antiquum]|uniref:Anaerobic ribonucleoside-triphosphate reductase activating protein n=1 Tax=Methanomicrobium antiquum TaxID=487686 RepID=A0AAF0FWT5_9EURY|nr:anaerobic ribonucleoside-triphosphate reductase activating protein [Methanomicrobium antiquum]MDD3977236.1 anaerobic ribonucleoside-triphosphate reductase activating protein [Methanomicrobium sp.]WFN37763.1 anaerobic ribonucleoside-triphosphate reductase activating protein [Methanomicrobium antiquum]
MKVNFGGFVPLSTVDWRGKAVCTVFLRGCPVRCHYCHNLILQSGQDFRDTDEILEMIKESRMVISGVIFSGGEPTMQKDALIEMAKKCKETGLLTGVQTNGAFPDTLESLINQGLLDLVHLDIKTRWEHYPKLLKVRPETIENIKKSLEICKKAHFSGKLNEFQVVCTLFPGREDDVFYISKETEGLDLILQQGVENSIIPLKFDDLKKIADKIHRKVRIRTREDGEVTYENNQIIIADSIVLTDISQARRNY